MTATSIVSLLLTGLVVGGLGRLVVPGRWFVPIWLTTGIGTLAAFAGSVLASTLGISSTPGIDWMEWLFQVVLAAIGVVIAVNLSAGRRRRALRSAPPRERTRFRADQIREEPPRSPGATPGQHVPNAAGSTAAPRRARPREPAASTAGQERVVSPPGPPRPSRVFVSYRRADTWSVARLLVDRLRLDFTRDEVFMDVDSIERGVDFVEAVRAAIRASAVVLVLIGSEWIAADRRSGRRRLDDPTDNVRMEIEYALSLDKMVIPVLVNDVAMPRSEQVPDRLRPLLRLNALHIRHLSWDRDIEDLVRDVRRWRP